MSNLGYLFINSKLFFPQPVFCFSPKPCSQFNYYNKTKDVSVVYSAMQTPQQEKKQKKKTESVPSSISEMKLVSQ